MHKKKAYEVLCCLGKRRNVTHSKAFSTSKQLQRARSPDFFPHLIDCESSLLWPSLPGRLDRGERWGCQCTSVVAVVTTMCFAAKSALPGGGAGPRRDREELFLKASSHWAAGGDLSGVLWRDSVSPNGRAVRVGCKNKEGFFFVFFFNMHGKFHWNSYSN